MNGVSTQPRLRKSGRNPLSSVSASLIRGLQRALGVTLPEEELGLPGGWDIDPGQFSDPESFAQWYLASELLSKYDDGLPSSEKEENTWRRFYEAEEMCKLTNERLKNPSFGPNPYSGRSPYSAIMLARNKISRLLGDFSWDEAAEGFGWGPGASTRLSRRKGHGAYKFSGIPESTLGNMALADAAICSSPIWKDSLLCGGERPKILPTLGNRIVTVPKNYKTNRVIAIEPCMNMYVQKGIGKMIRRRLKRVRIDLDDQRRNQELAREGSLLGNLATIDLSMASDTVSREIVSLLIPPDWVTALEQCRSPVGVLPSGDVINYQKFSSMGNGYTFELESLIFWGLCAAVSELYNEKDRRVAVYGDDIIVPTAIAAPVLEVLEVAGFKSNYKKTFSSGPFRESCGKHYFQGHDVSPFYVRRRVDSLKELFLFHNNLTRWVARVQPSYLDEFRSVRDAARSAAPAKWHRPRLPDGYGDGAFIGSFTECLPQRAPHGYEGWRCRVLADVALPLPKQPDNIGRLLYGLTSISGAWPDGPVPSISHACSNAGTGAKEKRHLISIEVAPRQVLCLVTQFPDYNPLL